MPRRLLILEAIVALGIARIGIELLPFRWFAGFFTRRPKQPERSGHAREAVVATVRAAIHAAARRLPGQTMCFPRAVAAQSMLRRRGIGTTLCYGAATSREGGLTTHVWLQDRGIGIIGHELAPRYRVLARFTAGSGEEGQ